MPKPGSTRDRRVSDLSLDDLADQVKARVLTPDSIEAQHIQQGAFNTLQLRSNASKKQITENNLSTSLKNNIDSARQLAELAAGSLSFRINKEVNSLEKKIESARQLAERAIGAASFRFQQQIDDIEGALAARIERAASLASSSLQPGMRAFLHSLKVRTVEFGFTVIATDTAITSTQATFYNVSTGGGNVTITLPSATTCQGLMLGFHKTLAANDMVIDGAATQTINGATTKTYSSQYDAVIIISNGSNWNIISGS